MSTALATRQTGGGLASAEPKLLAAFAPIPWRAWGEERSQAVEAGLTLVQICTGGVRPERLPRARELAQCFREAAPDLVAFDAMLSVVRPAAAAPADYAVSRMCVGLLIDAFPNGRPGDFTRYAESLLHDVMDLDFGPAVVARGCQAVRRSSEFLPTSARLIAACTLARSELVATLRHLERLRTYAQAAADILELEEGGAAA